MDILSNGDGTFCTAMKVELNSTSGLYEDECWMIPSTRR